MKMYLISDNLDTLTGMRLAGVDGIVVHERDELKETIEKAMSDPEIGIVLLTEKFGREFPELIDVVYSLAAPRRTTLCEPVLLLMHLFRRLLLILFHIYELHLHML